MDFQDHEILKKYKYTDLMSNRIRQILIVSSSYDYFTLEQDGQLTEKIFSEYVELNLRFSPGIDHACNLKEALKALKKKEYDLVILMARLGHFDVKKFINKFKKIEPWLPIAVLTYDTAGRRRQTLYEIQKKIKYNFIWSGDPALIVAVIKLIEDRINLKKDLETGRVKVLIVLEDSIRYYSIFLPLMYQELVRQTQHVISDEFNDRLKLYRMRTRPKILMARCVEEARMLFKKYRKYVMGIISDVSVPEKLGKKAIDDGGLKFIKSVRVMEPHLPVAFQSSDKVAEMARELHAGFIDKNSPSLLEEIRHFMRINLGFGEFVFRFPDGRIICKASNLRELSEKILEIDDTSLIYHAKHNHFSTWLYARGHYKLARKLSKWDSDEFEEDEELRSFLIFEIGKTRRLNRSGTIATYSGEHYFPDNDFIRIGSGSLGGKARGLAFISNLLANKKIPSKIAGVKIKLPETVVLGTSIFENFIESADLEFWQFKNLKDNEIDKIFLNKKIPFENLRHIKAVVDNFWGRPIAVRSSSIFEDSYDMPFAGVYKTIMLPNCNYDRSFCLAELAKAIKLIYASVYHNGAQRYQKAAPQICGSDQMAVVIQEIAGRQYDKYHYPNFSGVAQSYNFYPIRFQKSEEGISSIALGMGKAIVEGEKALRFSPSHPNILPQFASTDMTLLNSQNHFYAVKMDHNFKIELPVYNSGDTIPISDNNDYDALVRLKLRDALKHKTLDPVGSIYDRTNDMIYPGTFRKGAPLVTFDKIFNYDEFPLCEVLKTLVPLCSNSFNGPVEIEFAVNLPKRKGGKAIFYILQIRPQANLFLDTQIKIEKIEKHKTLCICNSVMGNSVKDDIKDIIFINPDTFNILETIEMATEINKINSKLQEEGKPYLLIGFGRWGSSDHFLGIPVTWDNISNAAAIVEISGEAGLIVEPSQGTHFFQNLTSFRIPYFSHNAKKDYLDWDFLKMSNYKVLSKHVNHLQLEHPIKIIAEGRSRKGIIIKPIDMLNSYEEDSTQSLLYDSKGL